MNETSTTAIVDINSSAIGEVSINDYAVGVVEVEG